MIAFQHGRADWVDPRYPVNGPVFKWDTIEWVVIHYTAALDLIDGDPGENADNLPAYLRSIHRDYLARQPIGYSIGYNAAVDWLGGTWELRGDTFKCAANADPDDSKESPADTGGDENAKSFAILMLVDGQDAATPLAAAAVRGLVAQIREQRPNVIVLGHRDVNQTLCPGSGLYAQVTAGVFEPAAPTPPPDPEPTPRPPEDEMTKLFMARLDTNPNQWRRGDGSIATVLRASEAGLMAALFAEGTPPRYYHPLTGETLTSLADVPLLTETQLDLWVGYPAYEYTLPDEG